MINTIINKRNKLIENCSNNIDKLNKLFSYPIKASAINIPNNIKSIDFIALQLTNEEINNYIDLYGRKHLHQYFMDIAYKVSERSTCIKRRVGSIIVKDNKIVSCGYNGPSKGRINCTPETCILDNNGKCGNFVQHAEQNAIIFATPDERKGATMYLTCQACSMCASAIANSGIVKVIYDQPHPPQKDILKEVNIEEYSLIEAIKKDLYNRELQVYYSMFIEYSINLLGELNA